jgi:hypothetical protein
MAEELTKGTKTMKALTCAKLRTVLATKLGNSSDDEYGELWRTGKLEVEFDHLPDLDIGKAGANTKRGAGTGKTRASKRTGAYTVVKVVKAANDEGKETALRGHIWTCKTVEEYFAAADPKYVTKTGTVITASMELNWCIKQGWIKMEA